MNNAITRTARIALAVAYFLSIPLFLSLFSWHLGLFAYVVYCGLYALAALIAAIALIWSGRFTPHACALLPVLKAMESFVSIFSNQNPASIWLHARQFLFPLIWLAIAAFLYIALRNNEAKEIGSPTRQ